jgi:hypothetical protein
VDERMTEVERQRGLAQFLCKSIGRENVRTEEHECRGVRVFIWDGCRNHPVWLSGVGGDGRAL